MLVVAWLRRSAAAACACLALSSSVAAREKVLFTSSVSYCAPPELILVQQFDLTYFAVNQSIFFNISAASVQNNVNVTANLALNIYGAHSVNITIDLCTLLNGALCPLPTYNFIGSETLSLADLNIDIGNNIPGIAYKIPDLEAFAQLTLRTVDTGEVKACVQSTLSNGWSTRQLAVEWVTAGLAIFALFSALLVTSLTSASTSRAPERFLDLMLLFQTIAASALLGLNYPVVYRAFATNFSWALGLFGASGEDSKIQKAIDNMRHHTGGKMTDTSGGDGVELVNRKLSPYNVAAVVSTEVRSAVQRLQRKLALKQATGSPSSTHEFTRRDSTVTVTDSNVLNAGIPVYVNSLGISTANAFMSVFLTLLMLTAIALAVLGIAWLVVLLVSRSREKKGKDAGRWEESREGYAAFSKSWSSRLILIVFFPVIIFSLHQWTLRDSWLATLFSVLTFLIILGCVVYASFMVIRCARRDRPDTLYEEHPFRSSLGPLYTPYRPPRWFFFTLPLSVLFAKAIIIAFGYASGLIQLIIIMIVEVLLFVSLLVFRPYTSRGADALSVTLSVARILITGLAFAFVESLQVAAIPRVAVGIAVAVVASLCVVLMFINLILNFPFKELWREHVSRRLGTRLGSTMRLGTWGRISPSPTQSGSAKDSMVDEKAGSGSASAAQLATEPRLRDGLDSDQDHERPRNPTPQQQQQQQSPFDPYIAYTPTPTTASTKAFASQRNSDYRVSYASSQMPSTGTTFDSFAAETSTTESGLGTELPRRSTYEGLGFDPFDYESGRPTAPPSQPQAPAGTGSKAEGWRPSPLLPRMSEGVEVESLVDGRTYVSKSGTCI